MNAADARLLDGLFERLDRRTCQLEREVAGIQYLLAVVVFLDGEAIEWSAGTLALSMDARISPSPYPAIRQAWGDFVLAKDRLLRVTSKDHRHPRAWRQSTRSKINLTFIARQPDGDYVGWQDEDKPLKG